MQTRGGKWLGRTEAHATFEVAWHEAAAMLPEAPAAAPSERQIDNILASGLPATRLENGRRKFEGGSVKRIAEVYAEGDGRYREIHATEHGPWGDIWRLHRAYSDEGMVVLMNWAYGEVLTGYPRRALQRMLEGGELPCSMVGNGYFVPRKALEECVVLGSGPSSSQGGSGTNQVPSEVLFTGAVTSHGIDIIQTPFQSRNRLP